MKLTKYVWDDAEGKLKPWPEIKEMDRIDSAAAGSPPEQELQEFLTGLQAALNQLAKASRVALSNKDFRAGENQSRNDSEKTKSEPVQTKPEPAGEDSDPGKIPGF